MTDESLHYDARQRLMELVSTNREGHIFQPIQNCIDNMRCAYANQRARAKELEKELIFEQAENKRLEAALLKIERLAYHTHMSFDEEAEEVNDE